MHYSLDLSRTALGDIVGALEQSPMVSYILDANLRVAYCNPAWNRFAAENAAPELAGAGALGIDLRQILGDGLRPFYMHAFAQARKAGKCGSVCTSARARTPSQVSDAHPPSPGRALLFDYELSGDRAAPYRARHCRVGGLPEFPRHDRDVQPLPLLPSSSPS